MNDLAKAIADVTVRKAQRICAPGKWRVYRKNGSVMVEIFERREP
jgi:hypothetical protein